MIGRRQKADISVLMHTVTEQPLASLNCTLSYFHVCLFGSVSSFSSILIFLNFFFMENVNYHHIQQRFPLSPAPFVFVVNFPFIDKN